MDIIFNKDGKSTDADSGETRDKPIRERFAMYRTTNGYGWMNDLGVNELKMLLIMGDRTSTKGTVEITKSLASNIEKHVGIKYGSMRTAVRGLKDKGYIKEVKPDIYMVQPATVFRGKSRFIGENIENYLDQNNYKKEK